MLCFYRHLISPNARYMPMATTNACFAMQQMCCLQATVLKSPPLYVNYI